MSIFDNILGNAPEEDQKETIDIKHKFYDSMPKDGAYVFKEENGCETRENFKLDCGHYMKANSQYNLTDGVSWTNKTACRMCSKTCAQCGRPLCIRGNSADGFKLPDTQDSKEEYLCTDCYRKWKRADSLKYFFQKLTV